MGKTKKGSGAVTSGKTTSKIWMEGPPWRDAGVGGSRGAITTKYRKSKAFPANYVLNKNTGRMEPPK